MSLRSNLIHCLRDAAGTASRRNCVLMISDVTHLVGFNAWAEEWCVSKISSEVDVESTDCVRDVVLAELPAGGAGEFSRNAMLATDLDSGTVLIDADYAIPVEGYPGWIAVASNDGTDLHVGKLKVLWSSITLEEED